MLVLAGGVKHVICSEWEVADTWCSMGLLKDADVFSQGNWK